MTEKSMETVPVGEYTPTSTEERDSMSRGRSRGGRWGGAKQSPDRKT